MSPLIKRRPAIWMAKGCAGQRRICPFGSLRSRGSPGRPFTRRRTTETRTDDDGSKWGIKSWKFMSNVFFFYFWLRGLFAPGEAEFNSQNKSEELSHVLQISDWDLRFWWHTSNWIQNPRWNGIFARLMRRWSRFSFRLFWRFKSAICDCVLGEHLRVYQIAATDTVNQKINFTETFSVENVITLKPPFR